MTTGNDSVEFKDFTDDRKPIRFMAQGEKYECHEALSIATTQEIATAAANVNEDNVLDGLDTFFSIVMDEDNASRLAAQMRSKTNPLTTAQSVNIMHWVLERYGLRPTQPSSD